MDPKICIDEFQKYSWVPNQCLQNQRNIFITLKKFLTYRVVKKCSSIFEKNYGVKKIFGS
jgi:hypothetical protein